MKKIQENNQIDKENKTSKFFIAKCNKQPDGTMDCIAAYNLINKNHPEKILFDDGDKYYYFVVDQNGKVIHQLNKFSERELIKVTGVTINYVNDNKLVITQETNGNTPFETNYINFYPRNITKRKLYDLHKGGALVGIDIPNPNKEVIIITRYNKKAKQYDSRLFSVKKGKFVSPSFSRLCMTKETGEDILRYEDDVHSNKMVNKKQYWTTLIGFITLDGIIGNTVYDTEINQTRDIGLRAGRMMEQYKTFRNRIKSELDYKFEEEKQIERRKQKFSERSILQLQKKVTRD